MKNDQENSPQKESENLPLAMNSRQTKVFDLLRGFSTACGKFHEWYHGAIQILNSNSPDKIAQAANSIRELCDKLPGIIANIPEFKNPISAMKPFGSRFLEIKEQAYKKGWGGEIINQPLDEILRNFENLFREPPRTKRFGRALAANDPQAGLLTKDWRKERDEAFESVVGFFQSVTHHNRLANEMEFREKLELFESLLLNYLTPCTEDQQRELLELMNATVNPESFARIEELIKHKTANFTFFFDKFENPDWLIILEQKGYFQNMPEPESSADGQIIYRQYVPLRALIRFARPYPKKVTDILTKLRLPENPQVGDQVFQCMANLNDSISIQRAAPLIKQFTASRSRTTWIWIRELLRSWIELELFSEVLAIIQGYLDQAVEKSTSLYSNDSESWLLRRIDDDFLERLSVQFPLEIASLVFQALTKWAHQERQKYYPSEIAVDAPVSYWFDDFKSPPSIYSGIEAVLATRLYSAAQHVYRQGVQRRINELDKILVSNTWQLFRRLRCQLYADFPSLSFTKARAEVIQQIPFLNEIGRGSLDFEFAQLLVNFSKQGRDNFLDANEVEQFVRSVMSGPIDQDGKLLEGDNSFFYRKQLWPISSLLAESQLLAYRALLPDDNMIKLVNYKPFQSGGFSGGEVVGVAPKEADNLELKDDKQLWELLNTWGLK